MLVKDGVFAQRHDLINNSEGTFYQRLDAYKLRFGSRFKLYFPSLKRAIVMALQPYNFLNMTFNLSVGHENQLFDQIKANITNFSNLGLTYHYGLVNGLLAVIFISSRVYLLLESLINLFSPERIRSTRVFAIFGSRFDYE